MPIRQIKPPTPELSEPAAPTPRAEVPNPPPRRRPPSPTENADVVAAPRVAVQATPDERVASPPRKGRLAREKRQPTGDYKVGFAKPPVEHQFKGKPGPGRPKGSLSHDTIVRRHYDQKHKIKVQGKEMLLPAREVMVMMHVKQALVSDPKLGFRKGWVISVRCDSVGVAKL